MNPDLTLYRAGSAWLLALPLLLSGCAAMLPAPVTPANAVLAVPVYQPAIALGGRISVRYQQEGKDESISGSFRWTQTPQQIVVTLLSPLNQTLATFEITPAEARLLEAGKAPRTAANIETLTHETFGWSLPVEGLRGWLQGFSLETGKPLPIAQPGNDNAAPVVTRDGWQIRYVSWQNQSPIPLTRPKRIDLQRTTPALGDMAIRIVIDDWQQP